LTPIALPGFYWVVSVPERGLTISPDVNTLTLEMGIIDKFSPLNLFRFQSAVAIEELLCGAASELGAAACSKKRPGP
jgi:hypothetical protein